MVNELNGSTGPPSQAKSRESTKGGSLGRASRSDSRGKTRLPVSLFVVVLLLCGWAANSLAQQSLKRASTELGRMSKVNALALFQDTQKILQTSASSAEPKTEQMTLVWWIPEEFWRVSSAYDTTITEDQIEELIKVLRPYTLIIVVDATMSSFGAVTYRPEADIRAGIQIKDARGTIYRPLSENKIDADSKNFLSIIMRPIFANTLGPMGQNMHFFLFPAKTKNGRNIADAKREGAFSVKLGEREFRWRLPLGSLLRPKICSKCKENCSGAWNFCPWCGTRLPKRI